MRVVCNLIGDPSAFKSRNKLECGQKLISSGSFPDNINYTLTRKMSLSKPAFRVYDHIENHYREKFVESVLTSAPKDELWYATEKIHGSNFSWVISSGSDANQSPEIRRARRGNFLGATEEFYGSLVLQAQYKDQLIKFYGLCQDFAQKLDITVQVVGEIYGGFYEGHKGKFKTKAVQKEIKYCPDVDVRAFDVIIDGEYQNYLQMISMFQSSSLPYCQILHQGTLQELLKLDPVFPTTIPALYGLEAIPTNDAEGYVLKPVVPRFITFSEDSIERVIFKLKNPKFSEKNEMNADPAKVVAVVEGIPENINETVASYVNQNRMDNVKSKLTEAEQKNKGKVIQGLIRDVLDELIRDLTDSNQYTETIKPTLKNLVSKEVAKFVMTKI